MLYHRAHNILHNTSGVSFSSTIHAVLQYTVGDPTCGMQLISERIHHKGKGAKEDDEWNDAGVEQCLR